MKMKKNYSFLIVVMMAFCLANSCTSHKKVINDDFAVDSADAGLSDADLTLDSELDGMSADTGSAPSDKASEGATDEFSEFDEPSGNVAQNTDSDGISDLENELNSMSNDNSSTAQNAPAEPVQPDVPAPETTPAPEIVQVEPAAPVVEEAPPAPEVVASPEPVTPSAPEAIAQVTNVEYKGNSNGGAFIVTSDIPLKYTTRLNASANQIIVEVQNAVISPKYTRALNTKDMSSSIDYINIYQKKGTHVARFVIQLRDGAPEPLVQPEGNSLLVLGSPMGVQPSHQNIAANTSDSNSSESSGSDTSFKGVEPDIAKKGILSSRDLEDFISGNNKFFGKEISIETSGMDIRDVLKFISEESGVNMVFDDDVKGTTAVRLRKVPWDQALVTILKSKKLGYRRQGSVLRIAKTTDLIEEDRVAIDLEKAKQTVEPLVVKNFAVNYADVNDLATKIEKYIADGRQNVATRGRVTGDTRTNTLIVSETAKKLKEIEQLIAALDTQPQQVMIEARIVEAKDTWSRTIAGQIGANRLVGSAGTTPPAAGQIVKDSLNLKSGQAGYTNANDIATSGTGITGSLFFGSFGAFGSLDAQLRLDESNQKVKILSSPRVAVMTNTSAEINQGVTIMIPQVTNNQGTTVTTYTPVQAGVKLKVTPQISNIGTVKLKLDVSRSSVSNLQTGSTDNRSANTELIVKNGDTAVIGGVFQSDILDDQSGVPGLKDIPILGYLFKGERKSNTKVELMMFVSPRIIPLLNQPTLLKADSSSDSVSQ